MQSLLQSIITGMISFLTAVSGNIAPITVNNIQHVNVATTSVVIESTSTLKSAPSIIIKNTNTPEKSNNAQPILKKPTTKVADMQVIVTPIKSKTTEENYMFVADLVYEQLIQANTDPVKITQNVNRLETDVTLEKSDVLNIINGIKDNTTLTDTKLKFEAKRALICENGINSFDQYKSDFINQRGIFSVDSNANPDQRRSMISLNADSYNSIVNKINQDIKAEGCDAYIAMRIKNYCKANNNNDRDCFN